MKYLTAMSSHGEIVADAETGIVLNLNRLNLSNESWGHRYIPVQFDLSEWHRRYPGEKLPRSLDILDLGYWFLDTESKCSGYEEPAEDWRLDREETRRKELKGTNT